MVATTNATTSSGRSYDKEKSIFFWIVLMSMIYSFLYSASKWQIQSYNKINVSTTASNIYIIMKSHFFWSALSRLCKSSEFNPNSLNYRRATRYGEYGKCKWENYIAFPKKMMYGQIVHYLPIFSSMTALP